MTDLQVSLIAIGIAIVVGVISYNKWQEYKTRKTVERAFSEDQHDGLMHGENVAAPHSRAEPVFTDQPALPAQAAPLEVAPGPPQEDLSDAPPPPAPEPTAMQETVLHTPR